jgi:uncharacterized protein (DUF1499 family)
MTRLALLLLPITASSFLTAKGRTLSPSCRAFQHEAVTPENSRRDLIASLLVGLAGSIAPPVHAEDHSITPCPPSAYTKSANCVSSASVRTVDLFAPPWTFDMTPGEAKARLKGAIQVDNTLSLIKEEEKYLKVQATRAFSTDELEFVINSADQVITFRSTQVDGPDNLGDFGANRKRLEEIRTRAGFQLMGAEFESADLAPRENAVGQLRAFYGLYSGSGYEDVLLGD